MWEIWGCRADCLDLYKSSVSLEHICMQRCYDVDMQMAFTARPTSKISGPKARLNLRIEHKPSKPHTWVCVHLLKQSTAVSRVCLCLEGVLTTNMRKREQIKWDVCVNVCSLLLHAGTEEQLRTNLQTAVHIRRRRKTENHFTLNLYLNF